MPFWTYSANRTGSIYFFVNIPISIFIIIAGLVTLPNNKDSNPKKIDVIGILIVVAMVLSLLYGFEEYRLL